MSIDITHITSIRNETLPAYLKYEGQSKPQPAYVELSEDGVVTAGANPEIGNAVTMDVWHRRTLQWSIDPGLTGAQIADAIQDALPLLERVHAGHTVEFDGSNMGGLLTEDAAEASAKLGRILEKLRSEVNVWSAADWLWTNDTLLTVWPEGTTLDDAVRDAQPYDSADVVEDDIRDAILKEAVSYTSQPRAGLTQWHLDALVGAGAIKPAHAAEYAEKSRPKIKATITENGGGLPNIGELCYDADSDTVYQIVGWDGSLSGNIRTNGPGCGNSIDALLVKRGRASDTTEEEWEAIESSNYGVTVDNGDDDNGDDE